MEDLLKKIDNEYEKCSVGGQNNTLFVNGSPIGNIIVRFVNNERKKELKNRELRALINSHCKDNSRKTEDDYVALSSDFFSVTGMKYTPGMCKNAEESDYSYLQFTMRGLNDDYLEICISKDDNWNHVMITPMSGIPGRLFPHSRFLQHEEMEYVKSFIFKEDEHVLEFYPGERSFNKEHDIFAFHLWEPKKTEYCDLISSLEEPYEVDLLSFNEYHNILVALKQFEKYIRCSVRLKDSSHNIIASEFPSREQMIYASHYFVETKTPSFQLYSSSQQDGNILHIYQPKKELLLPSRYYFKK